MTIALLQLHFIAYSRQAHDSD